MPITNSELRAEMARHGHTAKDIAKIINTCVQVAYRKINGDSEMSFKEVQALCKIYKKRPDELFPD